MGERKDGREQGKDRFQLAAPTPDGPSCCIELCGNRRATIEGCGGVLEYDPETVKLRMGKLCVRFSGRNLKIRSMTRDALVLEGFISGLEYLI